MKKAKLALTIIAILAIISSSLALKLTRIPNPFFLQTTTTTLGGYITSLCTVESWLSYHTVAAGGFFITASLSSAAGPCPTNMRVIFNE